LNKGMTKINLWGSRIVLYIFIKCIYMTGYKYAHDVLGYFRVLKSPYNRNVNNEFITDQLLGSTKGKKHSKL
jgi:hypothetical protein